MPERAIVLAPRLMADSATGRAFAYRPPLRVLRLNPWWERERGQALVELAMVLPFLLYLLMAILDFGVAYQRYIQLTNAVRDGARYATTYPLAIDNAASADPNNVKFLVKREASSITLQDSNIAIYYETYGVNPPSSHDASVPAFAVYAASGNAVRVRASWTYVPFTPFLQMLVPNGSFNVTTNAVMQIQ